MPLTFQEKMRIWFWSGLRGVMGRDGRERARGGGRGVVALIAVFLAMAEEEEERCWRLRGGGEMERVSGIVVPRHLTCGLLNRLKECWGAERRSDCRVSNECAVQPQRLDYYWLL